VSPLSIPKTLALLIIPVFLYGKDPHIVYRVTHPDVRELNILADKNLGKIKDVADSMQ